MHWFVLLVRTNSEEQVLNLFKSLLNDRIYKPFIPKKAWPHVKGKNVHKEIKISFPGYVFFQSQESVDDFIRNVRPIVNNIKDAYYFLYYGEDKNDIAMRDSERRQIESLMDDAFLMDSSLGFIEGDYVKITSGALIGMESKIIKINKRKNTAVINMDMLGAVRPLTMMLEVLTKLE